MKALKQVLLSVTIMSLVASSAWAIPILTIKTGGTIVSVHDNGVGDLNPALGVVSYSSSFSDWSICASMGIDMTAIGNLDIAQLHLNTVEVSSLNGGTIDIWFSDTFNIPNLLGVTSEVGGVSSGSVFTEAIIDGASLAVQTFGMGSFNGTESEAITATGSSDWNLTSHIRITHTKLGSTSVDQIVTVPEPGTMILLGSGLFGIVLAVRRRKN